MGNHRSVVALVKSPVKGRSAGSESPPQDPIAVLEHTMAKSDLATGFNLMQTALGLDEYWDADRWQHQGLPNSILTTQANLQSQGWTKIVAPPHIDGVSHKVFWQSPDGQKWMQKNDPEFPLPNEAVVSRMFHKMGIPGVPVWTVYDESTLSYSTLQPLLPHMKWPDEDSGFSAHLGWGGQNMAQRLGIWSVLAVDQHPLNFLQPKDGVPYRIPIDLQRSLDYEDYEADEDPSFFDDSSFDEDEWGTLPAKQKTLIREKVLAWTQSLSHDLQQHPDQWSREALGIPHGLGTDSCETFVNQAWTGWSERIRHFPEHFQQWANTRLS